jgi:hypothetical protein
MKWYISALELSTIFNHDFGAGFARSTTNPLDRTDNIHALHNRSKNNVFAI